MKVYKFALTALLVALTCGTTFADDDLNLFNIQSSTEPERIPATTPDEETTSPVIATTAPAPPVVMTRSNTDFEVGSPAELNLFSVTVEEEANTASHGVVHQAPGFLPQHGTQKSILQKGVSQKGVSQKGISQKGVAQKDALLKGFALKGISQKGIAQKGCGCVQNQGGIIEMCTDCCCCSGWTADIEATFFRMHRSDGFDNDNVFGFELAPRVSIARVNCDGLGVRGRWWSYDHANTDASGQHSMDTYNIDVELYQEVELTCATRVEVSGGVRYNDFQYISPIAVANQDTFTALGGMFALEARRDLCRGTVYTRLREVIMMSDWGDENRGQDGFDVTRSVTELAAGFETCRCLGNGTIMTINAGVEWQQWENYIEGRTDDNEPVDIGFGGFVLGVGFDF